jgi:hypothetical protein
VIVAAASIAAVFELPASCRPVGRLDAIMEPLTGTRDRTNVYVNHCRRLGGLIGDEGFVFVHQDRERSTSTFFLMQLSGKTMHLGASCVVSRRAGACARCLGTRDGADDCISCME